MSVETSGIGRVRFWAGMLGAPFVFAAIAVSPLPLDESAHRLAAIFAAVIVLWVSEAVPIAATALLIAPLLVLSGVTDSKEAFRHYADPILYLFVGGLMLAEAMRKHGLDRRIAKAIVGSRWVRGMPTRARLALIVAGLSMSMWISNTATSAILLPIALGMIGARRPGDNAAAGALLAVAHSASIGGLGTMVGSPPNLITVRLLEGGVTFGFLDWMAIGVPTSLVLGALLFLLLQRMLPPAPLEEPGGDVFSDVDPRWSRGEIATAVAFGLAVLGWILPGAAGVLALPFASELGRLLEPSVVAVVAASVLFFVPDGRGARVLRWEDAVRIDWGIILLFGGGIALGTQLVDTGLARVLSEAFVSGTGVESVGLLIAMCIAVTILLSELCSNTATAAILVPLVIEVSNDLGVSPIAPVLAVGLAASIGFMLPIATGPNALVYGTGRITQTQMIRVGFVLDVVAGAIVFAVVYLLCPLFGWT